MRRYLVVANRTLGGAALAAFVKERVASEPCVFHIVVPAARPKGDAVWTEGEARDVARRRLDTAQRWFEDSGAQVTGEVGDQQPLLAIGDALIAQPFDEIVLSTLPAGASRWLKVDLPARVRRAYGIPVTHVVADENDIRRTA